ncbi:Sterile alpha motif domain-containing protein [Cynara cardunculus var. scolymus]|uniref:Sterile alpha motif domain-containing protein n=1 Tax=Cynara cardunculus var. scolymus TaxID=59895 RepID=A0A103YAP0_CYNCS|nr:Sterile alpha motif domain-containing protein [Cynara cardunculus var. scolymus]
MADTSRSQVTITLGRSGQVVKRAGAVLDSELSGPVPAVGSKRSVRDRLGSSVDAVQLDNKRCESAVPWPLKKAKVERGGHYLAGLGIRLRADNGGWSLKASNCMDVRVLILSSFLCPEDFHLSKDDLRFKIMKRTQSNGQQNTVDLRDMLSRRTRPSTTNPVTSHSMHEPRHGRQRAPEISHETRDDRRRMTEPRNERQFVLEPRDERRHMLEPRDERQRMPQPRDDRRRVPESRDDRQRMAEPRDSRQCMPEPLEVRQRIPKLNDVRQRIPEPTNTSMTGQFTSMRTSEVPSQMNLLRNSYSPWTLDHIRRKSPDRVLNNSRGSSPPRRAEEPQRRAMMRAYDDPRTLTYANRDVSEISRPMTTTSFLSKPSLSAGPTKPVGPLVAPPLPPGGILQRSQYPVEEHLTVEGFLRSLGLDKYVLSFKVEEVDMAALSQMGDHDLKELGIPMGPRKKILLGLVARARRLARG